MSRTRVKICGITCAQDLDAAVRAGADAVGFVCYSPSPRAIDYARLQILSRAAPPFVIRVGLFVNTSPEQVRTALTLASLDLLQFHGDETVETDAYCRQFGRPYLKAVQVTPDLDLAAFVARYPGAQGFLLDACVPGYGGGGQTFDWSQIPPHWHRPLILAGGLNAANVGEAVQRVRPWAVDVSSGVERDGDKRRKDAAKIEAFISSVRQADAALCELP